MFTTYLAAVAFAIAGLVLGGINVWNNSMAINGGTFQWNDLTMLVAGLAVTSSMLSMALVPVSRQSRKLAALMLVTIVGCQATSLHYTVSRVGGVSDNGAQAAEAHNAAYQRAKVRVGELQSLIGPQQEVAALECRGFREGKSKSQRWPKCMTARGLLKDYRAELATHREALDTLGAERIVDPAATRISAAIGGLITARQYRLALPLITAGSLELGCNLLLAIAGMFWTGNRRERSAVVIEAVAKPVSPVLTALEQHGATSNRELAKRIGWSEARTSKAVRQLRHDGHLTSTQTGRQKLIALV